MSYLTLHVYDGNGKLVYEKDTDAAIFRTVAYYLNATLCMSGILAQNESYSLITVPRFDGNPDFQQPKLDTLSSERDKHTYQPGLHFYLESEDYQPSKPVRFFRFFMITARNLVYLWDSKVEDLAYVNRMVRDALVRGGYLQPNERVRCEFTVATEGRPEPGERIYQQGNPDHIFEMMEDDQPDLKEQRLESYRGLQVFGNVSRNAPIILIQADILSRVFGLVREGMADTKEVAGMMLGQPFHVPNSSQFLIEINQIIEAKNAPANLTSVKFTVEVQDHLDQIKSEQFPDTFKVGWYHSHPLPSGEPVEGENRSGIFFSDMDMHVHRQFREPWQVAMVVDGAGLSAVFYRWEDKNCKKIVEVPGFYSYQTNQMSP